MKNKRIRIENSFNCPMLIRIEPEAEELELNVNSAITISSEITENDGINEINLDICEADGRPYLIIYLNDSGKSDVELI